MNEALSLELNQPDLAQEVAVHQGVVEGLRLAEKQGFDLHAAVQANHGSDIAPEKVELSVANTIAKAGDIAQELQLERTFFERPANTILLMGIADSWNTTEAKIAQSTERNTKLIDEREMLAEVGLMIGGKNSLTARDLASTYSGAEKFVASSEESADETERTEFLKSINDAELAEKVKAVIERDSSGLLQEQRAAFGAGGTSERPFEVKVLKLSNKYDLQRAGVLQKIEWPKWEATDDPREKELQKQASDTALALSAEQDEFAKPYQDNEKEYSDRFADRFGNLPPAFVNRTDDGKITMYLKAADAFTLLRLNETGSGSDLSRDDEETLATVRHEYAHTQRTMTMGANDQLGLVLEERMAELVSHDKMGYQDVKFLVNDLAMVNDSEILGGLKESLKSSDALSSFLTWSANNIGLRNTLLLMASKPRPYDADPSRAADFANMKGIKHTHDASFHDAIVRENLEAKGDEHVKRRAASWAGKVLLEGGHERANFIQESFLPYRTHHGLSHVSSYLDDAINNAVEVKHT